MQLSSSNFCNLFYLFLRKLLNSTPAKLLKWSAVPYRTLDILKDYFKAVQAIAEGRGRRLWALNVTLLNLTYYALLNCVLFLLSSTTNWLDSHPRVHLALYDLVHFICGIQQIYPFYVLFIIVVIYFYLTFFFWPSPKLNAIMRAYLFGSKKKNQATLISFRFLLYHKRGTPLAEMVRTTALVAMNLNIPFMLVADFAIVAIVIFMGRKMALPLGTFFENESYHFLVNLFLLFLHLLHAISFAIFPLAMIFIFPLLVSGYFVPAVLALYLQLKENVAQTKKALLRYRNKETNSSYQLTATLRANIFIFKMLFTTDEYISRPFTFFLFNGMPYSAYLVVLLLTGKVNASDNLLGTIVLIAFIGIAWAGSFFFHLLLAFTNKHFERAAGHLLSFSGLHLSQGLQLPLSTRLLVWRTIQRLHVHHGCGFKYAFFGALVTMSSFSKLCLFYGELLMYSVSMTAK